MNSLNEISNTINSLKIEMSELLKLIDDPQHSEEYKLKIIKERLTNIISS